MRYILSIFCLLLSFTVSAQLTASGNSAVRYTSYPSAKDPIFIFCNASGVQKGNLNAELPEGTAPSDFSWFRWSDASNSFSVPLKTETAVSSSSLNDLTEGGYKVIVSGGIDTSYTGWIFIDKPYSGASLMNRTCDYVALNGEAAIDTFIYKNPANGSQIKLPNKYKFLWSSNPPSTIPFPDLEIDPVIYTPPLVDVTYKLQVSDSFGCISESSFFYESIHVKADFSVDPEKGEAPLEVSFTDKSIRGSIYRWEFGDGKDSISEDRNPDPHTYYIPGEYSVKLTIESDLHCIDSMRFEKIVVDPSELDIPNVFTPNNDGLNDKFMVQKKSLKFLSVEIFSRSGKMVYSFEGEGEALMNWEGWDGKVNKSSADATPGVYFYVIRARGWDDVEYDSKLQRGFVYLYR